MTAAEPSARFAVKQPRQLLVLALAQALVAHLARSYGFRQTAAITEPHVKTEVSRNPWLTSEAFFVAWSAILMPANDTHKPWVGIQVVS